MVEGLHLEKLLSFQVHFLGLQLSKGNFEEDFRMCG
jgi:hypothetical protein